MPSRPPPQPNALGPCAAAVAVLPEPGPPGLDQDLLDRVEALEHQLGELGDAFRRLRARVMALESGTVGAAEEREAGEEQEDSAAAEHEQEHQQHWGQHEDEQQQLEQQLEQQPEWQPWDGAWWWRRG